MADIWHTNIRGLMNNFDDLKGRILLHNPLFVFVSETFLTASVPDSAINNNQGH